jgi:hypothetical protein
MLLVNQLDGFNAYTSTAAPPSVSYRTFVQSGTNTDTYSFATTDIGTASATRTVVLVVAGSNASTTVSSVTVGGISATYRGRAQGGVTTTEIWTCPVPTGSTATIVVVWSSSQLRCGVGVFACYDLTSDTPITTATATTQSSSLNVNVLVGDILIVGGHSSLTTSATATGYNERYDSLDGDSATHSGGDATIGTAASPRTVTLAWAGNGNQSAISAVFR